MIEPGNVALVLSLLLSLYATLVLYTGFIRREAGYLESAENAVYFSTLFLTSASLILLYYLLTDNFSIEYVFSHSNAALPLNYKLSAFWAGSEGSLLLWVWILSLLIAFFVKMEKRDMLTVSSTLILLLVKNFLLIVLILFLNPFRTIDFLPPHGLGLNPLLETHEMIFHPPALFTGYAAATFPFALSLAGIYLADDRWVFRVRKWIVFSWIWLTAGIVIGAFWAYRVLGWGGFWGWDPVENASLLPWLTVTALLHSIMIQEARQGMKLWNALLSLASFEFVFLGTFLTRSGVIGSVHAFGQSGLSAPLTFFMLTTLFISLAVINERRDYIRGLDVVESAISKEASFLLNNLLFTAFAMSVLWGTVFPILSEAVVGYKATIGEKYYLQVTSPLAFSLIALIGLCVGLQWRKSDARTLKKLLSIFIASSISSVALGFILDLEVRGMLSFSLAAFSLALQILQYLRDTVIFKKEFGNLSFLKIVLRKRRRYGGYTAHLGVILVFLGVVGNWVYAEEHELNLKIDEPYSLGDYIFIYRGHLTKNTSFKSAVEVKIDVVSPGNTVTATPEIEYHFLRNQDVTRVEIIHEPLKDIYIIPEVVDDEKAVVKIKFNPLTGFIWSGALIMMIGGLLSLTPRKVVSWIAEVKK